MLNDPMQCAAMRCGGAMSLGAVLSTAGAILYYRGVSGHSDTRACVAAPGDLGSAASVRADIRLQMTQLCKA
jgi:hypothetical protein